MAESATGNCSESLSLSGHPTDKELHCEDGDQVFGVLRSVLVPSYVLILTISLVACALVIFAVQRANKRTLTARLLLWSTVIDAVMSTLMLGVVFTTVVLKRWVFGASICKLTGYLAVTLRITGTLILMLLAVIRYLALSNPCAARETTLYQTAGNGVILAMFIGATAAAFPFFNNPGYGYIQDIFRCDLDGGWAVQMTSLVFNVLPLIVIIGLTVLSLKTIKQVNWQRRTYIIEPTPTDDVPIQIRKPKPTLTEVRASRGIAIALLSTVITTLPFMASHQLSGFIPVSARKPMLLTSGIIYGLYPTIRSTLLVATSPVLKAVLKNWLLVRAQVRSFDQHNFRLIQQRFAAPSPSHEMVNPCRGLKQPATMTTAQVDPSHNDESPTNVDRFHRLSTTSTISGDVYFDANRDTYVTSHYGDITTAPCRWPSNDALNSEASHTPTSPSLVALVGSSLVDVQNHVCSSVSTVSAKTITSVNFPRPKSARIIDRDVDITGEFHGQTSRSQSAAFTNSLSGADGRYHHHSCQSMSSPGAVKPQEQLSCVSLPKIPGIPVASDGMSPVFVD